MHCNTFSSENYHFYAFKILCILHLHLSVMGSLLLQNKELFSSFVTRGAVQVHYLPVTWQPGEVGSAVITCDGFISALSRIE